MSIGPDIQLPKQLLSFEIFQQRTNPIHLFDKRLYYYGRNNSSEILNMIILLSELFGGINGGIFMNKKIFIL